MILHEEKNDGPCDEKMMDHIYTVRAHAPICGVIGYIKDNLYVSG